MLCDQSVSSLRFQIGNIFLHSTEQTSPLHLLSELEGAKEASSLYLSEQEQSTNINICPPPHPQADNMHLWSYPTLDQCILIYSLSSV